MCLEGFGCMYVICLYICVWCMCWSAQDQQRLHKRASFFFSGRRKLEKVFKKFHPGSKASMQVVHVLGHLESCNGLATTTQRTLTKHSSDQSLSWSKQRGPPSLQTCAWALWWNNHSASAPCTCLGLLAGTCCSLHKEQPRAECHSPKTSAKWPKHKWPGQATLTVVCSLREKAASTQGSLSWLPTRRLRTQQSLPPPCPW